MHKPKRTRGRKWLAIRARQLRKEPRCQHCLTAGKLSAATEVDHRIRVQDGGTDDEDNLQSLCHECHAVKTAEENGGTRRFQVGLDGWPAP